MVYTGQVPKQGVRSRLMAGELVPVAAPACSVAGTEVREAQEVIPSARPAIKSLITALPVPA